MCRWSRDVSFRLHEVLQRLVLSFRTVCQVPSKVLSLEQLAATTNAKMTYSNNLGRYLVVEQYHAIHGTDEQYAQTVLVDVTDLWFMMGHMHTSQKAVYARCWRALIPSMPRANSVSQSQVSTNLLCRSLDDYCAESTGNRLCAEGDIHDGQLLFVSDEGLVIQCMTGHSLQI